MNRRTFVFAVIFAAAVLLQVATSVKVSASSDTHLAQFKKFMNDHNKQYSSAKEFNTRLEIFKSNLDVIASLNARNSSAKFGVNKFADLSAQEFKQQYLNLKVESTQGYPVLPHLSEEKIQALPDSWDWRQKGAVTGVKDQGQCGSCWAFSTIGNIEGQWALAGNTLVGLSEQNLVDCDKTCSNGACDAGCDGGLMSNAFQYVIANNGIDTENSYPYEAVDNTCRFKSANVGAKISNWTMIPSDETQMAAYVNQQGPVSIAVDAQLWQFYIEGIFDFYFCGSTLDHGVLIVGFGHGENIFFEDTDFWIIKNSWGADWGESGYIRLERGENLCGVNLFPCTSFVH